MKYSNIRQRINFYQAGKAIATATLSAIPGFGEAIDIAGIITGLATGNFTEAALSALGLILPGVSGSSFKAGKEVVEALGKKNAKKIGKQLTKKIHPEAEKIIKESLNVSPDGLKKIGQEIVDEVSLDNIIKKLKKPPKDIQHISTLPQLKDRNILKQFNLVEDEQDLLIARLEALPQLPKASRTQLINMFEDVKKKTNPIKIVSAENSAKAQAKRLEDKLNKVLTSNSGVKFNPGIRFQGIPFFKESDQLEKHLDTWIRHVEDEYLGLADDLVNKGDLIKGEGNKWLGKFGDKLKPVNPVDYVMSRSKAFKEAGLQFSGTPYYSGMTSQPYNQFVKNGGTEAPMGIWTTSTRPVAEYYAQYSQSGIKSNGVGHVIDIVGPRIDQVERATGRSSNYFDVFGRNVGAVAKDNPNALNVFSNYTDDLVPKAGPIKTVVYPAGTQVKSLRFNNGDFAMSNYFPFSKKGGIINYYEYVCN